MTRFLITLKGIGHTFRQPAVLAFLLSLLLQLLVCCSASAQASGNTSAAEPTYRITATELARWKQNLNELQQINVSNQNESKTLRQQLKISQTQLTQAEQQLEAQKLISQELMRQLDGLKQANQEQKNSLQTANELFQQSRQEEHKKLNESKQNVWKGTGIGFLVGAGIAYALSK